MSHSANRDVILSLQSEHPQAVATARNTSKKSLLNFEDNVHQRPISSKVFDANTLVNIHIISATRLCEIEFWEKSALGQSLQRISQQYQHNPYTSLNFNIAFDNKLGLSEVFNTQISSAPASTVLVFIHDDVWIDDTDFIAKLMMGLAEFDVIGVVGNVRHLPHQPAWCYINHHFVSDHQSNLSGQVAHGKHALGVISKFGATPKACLLLDGVLMASTQECLVKNNVLFDVQFDFHFYDLDFCRTATKAGLKIGTWPISLTHQGLGDFGCLVWRKRYQQYLDKWEPTVTDADLIAYLQETKQQQHELELAIDEVLKLALHHEKVGEQAHAIQLYKEVIAIAPQHAHANYQLGLLEMHTLGLDSALPRLETAIQSAPECETFWVAYIKTLMQLGAVEEAATAIEMGQQYALTAEKAQLLASDFVRALESGINQNTTQSLFNQTLNHSFSSPQNIITLIPAYKPQFIAELLHGLMSQTYKPAKVIISDDSPNNEITRLFNQAPFQAIAHKLNIQVIIGPKKGAMSNVVHLLNIWAESSPLVHILFDDDVIYPTFYHQHILAHQQKNIGVSISYRWLANENGSPESVSLVPNFVSKSTQSIDSYNHQQLFASIIPNCNNWLGEFSNSVFSRDCVGKYRDSMLQNIPYYGLGDIGVFLDISLTHDVALIKMHLGVFRKNAQQNSQNYDSAVFKCGRIAWIALALGAFKSGEISISQLQQCIKTTHKVVAHEYKNDATMQDFIQLFAEAKAEISEVGFANVIVGSTNFESIANFEAKFMQLWQTLLNCQDWLYAQQMKSKSPLLAERYD